MQIWEIQQSHILIGSLGTESLSQVLIQCEQLQWEHTSFLNAWLSFFSLALHLCSHGAQNILFLLNVLEILCNCFISSLICSIASCLRRGPVSILFSKCILWATSCGAWHAIGLWETLVGWMESWMNRWKDRSTDAWIHELMTDRWMDGWINRMMNG